jgi:hypothetical protein
VHKSFSTYVAQIAEVEKASDGKLKEGGMIEQTNFHNG